MQPDRSKARNALILNLLATPGLGTWMVVVYTAAMGVGFVLFDGETGAPVCIAHAGEITAIRTGAAGQPMSKYQLRGVTPIPEIVVARSGDKTTGYPEMSFNFTNMYTIAEGFLKGVRLGGTANLAWKRADYYYYPNGYGDRKSTRLNSSHRT